MSDAPGVDEQQMAKWPPCQLAGVHIRIIYDHYLLYAFSRQTCATPEPEPTSSPM